MRSVKATSEERSYTPWVLMTNTVLRALRDKSVADAKAYNTDIDLIHIPNDPNMLEFNFNNTLSRRKPDAVFVPRAVASSVYGQESWQELAQKWAVVPPTEEGRTEKRRASNAKGEGKEGKGKGKGKDLPSLDWGDALSSVEHKRILKPRSVNIQRSSHFTKEGRSFQKVLAREGIWRVQDILDQGRLSESKKRKRKEEVNEDVGEDVDAGEDEDEKVPSKKKRPVGSE